MMGLVLLVRTVADPPSPLRQLAYREGTPVLGPDIDPTGWKVHPPVSIEGTLFNTRPFRVQCTVRRSLILVIVSPFFTLRSARNSSSRTSHDPIHCHLRADILVCCSSPVLSMHPFHYCLLCRARTRRHWISSYLHRSCSSYVPFPSALTP